MPSDAILTAQTLLTGIINFLPNLIVAVLILIIGWLIASALGKGLATLLKQSKLDDLLDKFGWREALEKADIKLSVSDFLGSVLKWVLVILVISLVAESLGLNQFATLLHRFVSWLPNLIASIFILIVAFILADILDKVIRSLTKKAQLRTAEVLGFLTRWLIYVFAVLMALVQLGVAKDLIVILFTGIVATLTLAFGISFGLGGKEIAAEILNELKRKIEEK